MSRRGFTIIELLVTVSILAVLISIAAPAIRSVQASARTQQCVANVRGIGQAALLWSNDVDGYWPHVGKAGQAFNIYYVEDTGNWLSWFDQMFRWTIPMSGYLEPQAAHCPWDPTHALVEQGQIAYSDHAPGGYVMSSSLITNWALWKEDDPIVTVDQLRPVRVAEVAHPSSKAMFVETFPHHLPGYDNAAYQAVIESNAFGALTHGVPTVRCDGSAQAPPINTLPQPVPYPESLVTEPVGYNTVIPLMNTWEGFLGRDF